MELKVDGIHEYEDAKGLTPINVDSSASGDTIFVSYELPDGTGLVLEVSRVMYLYELDRRPIIDLQEVLRQYKYNGGFDGLDVEEEDFEELGKVVRGHIDLLDRVDLFDWTYHVSQLRLGKVYVKGEWALLDQK
jgi:hypothetical protein